MKPDIMKAIREFNHKGIKGRSLTTIEQVRDSQIRLHTNNYNSQYEGRAIFTPTQVILIMFNTTLEEYRSRPIGIEHLRYLWINRKGKYLNNFKVV